MASVCAATGGNKAQAAALPDLDTVDPKSSAEQAPRGDRIVLKSGHALDGVRLLRRTPLHLVLEIVPGIEPLLIPRGQVVLVAQGAHPVVHAAADSPDAHAISSEPDVLAAVRMSPDFIERISTPLAEEERIFDRQDVVNVIRLAGALCGVPVEIDPAVEGEPMERRLGRWRLPAGASFEDFLRVHLANQAPWLECRFESDLVRILMAGDTGGPISPAESNEISEPGDARPDPGLSHD